MDCRGASSSEVGVLLQVKREATLQEWQVQRLLVPIKITLNNRKKRRIPVVAELHPRLD